MGAEEQEQGRVGAAIRRRSVSFTQLVYLEYTA